MHPPAARSTTGSAPAPPRRTASAPCTPGCSATSEPAEQLVKPHSSVRRNASPWDGVTYTWLGASLFWLGHEKEGQAALREAVERCRAASFRPPWIHCLSMLSLTHHLQGDQNAARAFSDEALAMSARAGLNEYSRLTAAAHITRAGPLTGTGRAEEARAELQRVVEVAHQGSGPVEIAHAQVALSHGGPGHGRHCRRTARSWTTPDRSSGRARTRTRDNCVSASS